MNPRYLVAIVAMLAGPAHAAQMFKCVDANGVTQYTDKPLPGCKGGPVDIKGAPPLSGSLKPRDEGLVQAEKDFQKRRADEERRDQAAAKQAAARKARCADLQAQYQRLTVARRVYRADEKGEREFVDDGARDQRAAALKAEIDRDCR